MLDLICLGYFPGHASPRTRANRVVQSFAWMSLWLAMGGVGCVRETQPNAAPTSSLSEAAPEKLVASASELLRHAEDAMRRGDLAAAEQNLKSLLVEQPDDPVATFLLARIRARQGDLSLAISLLESIPSSEPSVGFAALGQRADYLSQLERFEESISLWREMLEVDESLHVVRSRLASDLYATGRRIESGWSLQQLADRGVASEDELRRLLNVTNAPQSLDELIQATHDRSRGKTPQEQTASSVHDSDMTLSRAWELIHQHRYRDAVNVLQAVGKTTPSIEATTLLAFLQTDLQQFEDARVTLATAPQEAVRYAPYWIAVGDDWAHKGEHQRSVSAYARAMLADSTWALTHERLVGALLRIGQVEQARKVDERRFDLELPIDACLAVGEGQPDDARAGGFLVQDLQQLGRVAQARNWLKHIAGRNPEAFGGHEAVTVLYQELLATPPGVSQLRQVAGLRISEFPDPTPVFHDELLQQSEATEKRIAGSVGISPPQFVDVADKTGLHVTYHNLPQRKTKHFRLHEGLGSGVAALDFDRDGWIDFYFGQGSGDPPNVQGTRANSLMRQWDGRFQSVTALAGADDRGYATGVTAGDWNQDGWDDLLVGNFGRNRLFLNQGDGTFIDATQRTGLCSDGFTSSVAFADVNADGFADIIEVTYLDDPAVFTPMVVDSDGIADNYPGPNQYRSGLDVVWLSQGNGMAKRVPLTESDNPLAESSSPSSVQQTAESSAPQIGDDASPGLGVLVGNLDSAPGLEIFVANDARPNQLWKVRSTAESVVLTQTAALQGLATSSSGRSTACMGVAASDFDRNGLVDLFVTNWFEEWVNLYRQSSPGIFHDSAPLYQLDKCSDRHVGFGTQGVDYDNDGWVDIFIANGHINDYSHLGQPLRMLPQLLINQHDHFEESLSTKPANDYWGTAHIGRCAITTDYNKDGLMDVVVTDLIDPAVLLENQTRTESHFIQFELVGTASERNAVGTRIEIMGANPVQVACTTSGDGYFGRNEPLVHFGLASQAASVSIQVTWPDDEKQQFDDLRVDSRYLLIQGEVTATDF